MLFHYVSRRLSSLAYVHDVALVSPIPDLETPASYPDTRKRELGYTWSMNPPRVVRRCRLLFIGMFWYFLIQQQPMLFVSTVISKTLTII